VPRGLQEGPGELWRLIDGKGQQHQERDHHGHILVPVSEVVFKVLALILEGVAGLILNLPARPAAAHQGGGMVLGDDEVRNPGAMFDLVTPDFPVFEEIDAHSCQFTPDNVPVIYG
jgi:hypothetical protein